MAQESSGTNRKLAEAIDDWSRRCGSDFDLAEPMSGTGNQTVKLKSVDEHYVLRVAGDSAHLGVDRQREQQVLKALEGYELAADLLYQGENYWVFEYLQPDGSPDLFATAKKLRGLHSLQSAWISNQPLWTPLDTIHEYIDLLPAGGIIFSRHLDVLKTTSWSQDQPSLCHVDLNPDNIIQTKNGVRFIDWEYARVGPPVYDLAVLLETHPHFATPTFLENYGVIPGAASLDATRLAYGVIEALWLGIVDPITWPKSALLDRAQTLSQRFL